MILGVTGGTGFVGGRLLEIAGQSRHRVHALARRPQPLRDRVEWIEGSLEDREALHRLVSDADAIIHVAGVVNAPDEAGFETGNVADGPSVGPGDELGLPR